MNLPEIQETEVIQVVMTGAFYNAHLKPLLERQDFLLAYAPTEGDSDGFTIDTYIITLGESRAALMKPRTGHVLP